MYSPNKQSWFLSNEATLGWGAIEGDPMGPLDKGLV